MSDKDYRAGLTDRCASCGAALRTDAERAMNPETGNSWCIGCAPTSPPPPANQCDCGATRFERGELQHFLGCASQTRRKPPANQAEKGPSGESLYVCETSGCNKWRHHPGECAPSAGPKIPADVFAKALEAYPPPGGISDIKHLAQLRQALNAATLAERKACGEIARKSRPYVYYTGENCADKNECDCPEEIAKQIESRRGV